MDSNLLLAFLAFGAACSSLWAWLIATAGEQRRGMEALGQPIRRLESPSSKASEG